MNSDDPTNEEIVAIMRAWFPLIATLAAIVLVLVAANSFVEDPPLARLDAATRVQP